MKTNSVSEVKRIIALHGVDSVINTLDAQFKKTGNTDEYALFLKELLHSYKTDNTNQTLIIETPFEISETLVKEIATFLKLQHVPVQVSINKTLIGGFVATYNHTRFDTSIKSALNRLYR